MDYLYSTYRAFNCRINVINKIYTVDAKTLNTSHLKLTLAPAFLIKTPFQKSSIPPPPHPNCAKFHRVIPQVHTMLMQRNHADADAEHLLWYK